MGYRCAILSDEGRSQQTSFVALRDFMTTMPHIKVVEGRPRHFVYRNGNSHFEFTLDLVDEEGETLLYDFDAGIPRDEKDPLIHDLVNVIQANCGWNQDRILELWNVCFPIAEFLGWRVLDHASGEFIESNNLQRRAVMATLVVVFTLGTGTLLYVLYKWLIQM